MILSYSKQTVLDYIAGNDIPEELIEKLEDNEQFMMEVIKLTQDKNMYHYCSSKVKNNFEFVKFLIRTFSTDDTFIKQVSDTYIENHQDEEDKINKLELSIILRDIYKKNQNETGLIHEQLLLNIAYTTELMEIEVSKQDEEVQDILDEIGLGFIYIKNDYAESEIVLDFFAGKFLSNIINNDDKDFETITHMHFTSLERLEEMGDINYIIEYVRNKDPYLAEYLSIKPEIVISETKKELSFIKKNWDSYLKRITQEKVSIVLEKLEEYESNGPGIDIEYRDIFEKIIIELGLKEIFKQNSDLYDIESNLEKENFEDDREEFLDAFDDDFDDINIDEWDSVFDEEKYTLFRKNMTNFIKKIFKTDIIDESLIDEYQEENDNNKCKVIKYDFNSRKVLNISNK